MQVALNRSDDASTINSVPNFSEIKGKFFLPLSLARNRTLLILKCESEVVFLSHKMKF